MQRTLQARYDAQKAAEIALAQNEVMKLAAMVYPVSGQETVVSQAITTVVPTYRNKGRLLPLTDRIIRLGDRGGLYEIRPVHGKAGVYQRVSLVPRDQKRCLYGLLPGAQGVCGYIEQDNKQGTATTVRIRNKHYGGYRLRSEAPDWVKQWVANDQEAARRGEGPVELPITAQASRKRPRFVAR